MLKNRIHCDTTAGPVARKRLPPVLEKLAARASVNIQGEPQCLTTFRQAFPLHGVRASHGKDLQRKIRIICCEILSVFLALR
jgi:hypothetical protein